MTRYDEMLRIKKDIKNLKEWLKKPQNTYFRLSLKLQLKYQKKLLKQLKNEQSRLLG